MKFDWYQATIKALPADVISAVLEALAPGGTVEHGRGRHNYRESFRVVDPSGNAVATLLAGGNPHPNIAATSDAAPALAMLLRDRWPQHRVTRCDTAVDAVSLGAFEQWERVCKDVAKDRGVAGLSVLPDDPSKGRTYYLGAKSSDVRVRLYDKTAETRARLTPDRWATVPEHWARLEVQVRPRGEAGYVVARIAPEAVWGCSGWSTELAQRALAADVNRVLMQAHRASSHEHAYRWMLIQHGGTLKRLLKECGDWQAVGLQLGADLDEVSRELKRRRTADKRR